jgi:hypothetical protein
VTARLRISDHEEWLLDTPSDTIVSGVLPRMRVASRPVRAKPWAMPYYRLTALIVAINVFAVVLHPVRGDWHLDDGSALEGLSAMLLVNLAVAVVIRQQQVLNALFHLAGRGRRTWPRWVRWSISKVNHVGGIHVGGAVCGSALLIAFAVVAEIARLRDPATVSLTTVALADLIALLAAVIVIGALPVVRARAHNVFELTHRFAGWTAVALFWPLVIDLSQGSLPADWHVWVLALVTLCIVSPWLRLRRVAVSVERPSNHAAIVTFDYGVTPAGSSAVGVSLSPLREWHAFATVTTPGASGYRILISRAGDWTGRFIDDPPTHVWVRGTPVSAPMAKVAMLHERVLYVVTGSGIGPVLGQILSADLPAQLVWSTRTPRTTFGDALVDEVLAKQPHAVIWDTTERGKPDMLQLVRRAYREFKAEAVFVVSNKAATFKLVEGLEREGIPAVGPIWDS